MAVGARGLLIRAGSGIVPRLHLTSENYEYLLHRDVTRPHRTAGSLRYTVFLSINCATVIAPNMVGQQRALRGAHKYDIFITRSIWYERCEACAACKRNSRRNSWAVSVSQSEVVRSNPNLSILQHLGVFSEENFRRTLLLCEMDGVILRNERQPSPLHIISTRRYELAYLLRSFESNTRAGPAHKRVFPSTATRKGIKVYPPFLSFCSSTLHSVACRLVNAHNTVTKLGCSMSVEN